MGQRSRLDETPAREGEIPIYIRWDDGSEYEAFGTPDGFIRRWIGPRFRDAPTSWVTEAVSLR